MWSLSEVYLQGKCACSKWQVPDLVCDAPVCAANQQTLGALKKKKAALGQLYQNY